MGEKTEKYESMDIVFTIVPRGIGDKVIKFVMEMGVGFSIVTLGCGTATSTILDILGLGATEKDIVLSFVKSDKSQKIIDNIIEKLNFDKPGTGISFSVPLQSIAGARVLRFLQTDSENKLHEGGEQNERQ